MSYGVIRSREEAEEREAKIKEYMKQGSSFPEAIRRVRGY